jgi:hypothetical protein
MNRPVRVKHEFVEFMPATLEPETIYVSVEYATCQHLCLCGCGEKVITPLTPTDWELTFDGEAISLDPSVGNWSFDCQSHYVIRKGRVRWAATWSKEKIKANEVGISDRRRRTTALPMTSRAPARGSRPPKTTSPASSCERLRASVSDAGRRAPLPGRSRARRGPAHRGHQRCPGRSPFTSAFACFRHWRPRAGGPIQSAAPPWMRERPLKPPRTVESRAKRVRGAGSS